MVTTIERPEVQVIEEKTVEQRQTRLPYWQQQYDLIMGRNADIGVPMCEGVLWRAWEAAALVRSTDGTESATVHAQQVVGERAYLSGTLAQAEYASIMGRV